MERVNEQTINGYLERYAVSRGGDFNEQTNSEAMFVLVGKYRGIYLLTTGKGPLWVGVSNAMARWTNGGEVFPSVRAATEVAFKDRRHPQFVALELWYSGLELWYSEDAVSRLRWIADRIAEQKASGEFLLWAEVS